MFLIMLASVWLHNHWCISNIPLFSLLVEVLVFLCKNLNAQNDQKPQSKNDQCIIKKYDKWISYANVLNSKLIEVNYNCNNDNKIRSK